MNADRLIHGAAGAVLAAQPLLLALGMDAELAAAIVGVVGAFIAGYRMERRPAA